MWLFEPGKEYEPSLEEDGRLTCMAFFPDKIPHEIFSGEFAHHVRHPAQPNDLVFAYSTDYKKPE